jgi:hypothetical protein
MGRIDYFGTNIAARVPRADWIVPDIEPRAAGTVASLKRVANLKKTWKTDSLQSTNDKKTKGRL